MLWQTSPALIHYDVDGWQQYKQWLGMESMKCLTQEYGPGVDGWNRRQAYLGALWLHAVGDEPILGFGNPFWTEAGMSIMDMTDGWTKEENVNGTCIIVDTLGSLLLDLYKGGGDRRPDSVLGKSCWITRTGSVFGLLTTMHGYLEYGIEVPCVCQWRLLWFSAPTEQSNDLRPHQLPGQVRKGDRCCSEGCLPLSLSKRMGT